MNEVIFTPQIQAIKSNIGTLHYEVLSYLLALYINYKNIKVSNGYLSFYTNRSENSIKESIKFLKKENYIYTKTKNKMRIIFINEIHIEKLYKISDPRAYIKSFKTNKSNSNSSKTDKKSNEVLFTPQIQKIKDKMTTIEYDVYSYMLGLYLIGKKIFFSADYMGKLIGKSAETIRRTRRNLIKNGWIEDYWINDKHYFSIVNSKIFSETGIKDIKYFVKKNTESKNQKKNRNLCDNTNSYESDAPINDLLLEDNCINQEKSVVVCTEINRNLCTYNRDYSKENKIKEKSSSDCYYSPILTDIASIYYNQIKHSNTITFDDKYEYIFNGNSIGYYFDKSINANRNINLQEMTNQWVKNLGQNKIDYDGNILIMDENHKHQITLENDKLKNNTSRVTMIKENNQKNELKAPKKLNAILNDQFQNMMSNVI